MSLYLPPYEYSDYVVDRRDPRPPLHADVILGRPRRKRRLLGRRGR